MLRNFSRFIRITWPAAVLVAASALILTFLGYTGDIALHHWLSALREQMGSGFLERLPPLSHWLARNYGMNEFDLIDTHFCFFWVFCIVFVASTFAPQHRFRRRFFIAFLLVWFLILAFWAFLAACAAMPFLYLISAWHRPPAIMPTLNRVFLWALPVLLVLLLVLRVAKGLTTRSSELRATGAARSRSP